MSHKIFENNLVAACKSKLALKLNTPAYTAMCTLELSPNSVMITNKYDNNSKLLFTDTLAYCMKSKLEISMKVLAVISVIFKPSYNTMIIQNFFLKSQR